jgi:hypothetical protein
MLTIVDKETLVMTTARRILTTPDLLAVFVVQIFAWCFAAVFLLLGVFDAIRTLVAQSVHVSVDADAPLGALGRLPVAIAIAIAWLCRRILQGDAPFTRALTRLTVFCALVLIVVPTAGNLLTDLGTNSAIDQLGMHGPVLTGFGFNVLPWIIGIVLAVIGELFRRGERAQRELEGLI